MTAAEALAEGVLAGKPLFTRYLQGFTARNATTQAPNLPNHAVWLLGHCALTMHRAAELTDRGALPEGDFVRGDGNPDRSRAAAAGKFDTEAVCFGSTPVDDPARYPPLERAVAVFEAACDRLAAAVRAADAAALERGVPWGSIEMPFRLLVARVCFHNGMHGGQLTDLRRALGLGRVVG